MNKKITIILAFLLTPALGAFSQHMPIPSVPTPEIAGLGQYGTIPVGLFTGVPDISIPLHEMKVAGQTYPITANYHLASVKPQMQEGCMGLGWSLKAGGYISRTVNGVYDEKMHTDGYSPGFYAQGYRMKGITDKQFSADTKHIISSNDKDPYYELTADEFSFSFFGYSGTFCYNEDGGWTVISDRDIRVEFNPADGEGFVKLAGLRSEIFPGNWVAKSKNNRYFNKFTLITPDGYRYEFGGIRATDYSISYYNRTHADLIASTWHLSKIVTPDNCIVTYRYEANDLLCDLKYVPQSKIVYNVPCTPQTPTHGRDAMVGFLLMPVRLASITTPDEEISLTYFEEMNYCERFWAGALGWNTDEYHPVTIFTPAQEYEMRQFSVFMNAELDYTNSSLLQQSIRKELRHSVLHRIAIQSRHAASVSKSLYLDYTFNNRRKLSLIASREGIPALIPNIVYVHGHAMLSSYEVPASPAPDKDLVYKFGYNKKNPMPDSYTNTETDYWGYYVGKNISFSALPEFTKPAPVETYMLSDVLTEIAYPTGGKNRFEYEENRYSQYVDNTHTLLKPQFGTAGGLRVKSVSRHDRSGALLNTTRYHYATDKKPGTNSSGILRELPFYEMYYQASDAVLEHKSEGGYFASVTNQNSPVVGYSCVIEETLNAAGRSEGYIKRRYSNYDTDIYGHAHLDESYLYSDAIGHSPVKPFTSRSEERGKLLSEEYYDNAGKLLKNCKIHYKAVNPGEFKSAHQLLLFFCADPNANFAYACAGTLTRVYTHSYLPDSMTETVYPSDGGSTGFSTERTLTYDNHRLLKQEKTLNSRGGHRTVNYTYPADHTDYRWMVSAHMLSPVVEKTTVEDGQSLKEIYQYDNHYNAYETNPYLKSISRLFGERSSRTDYQVEVTDGYANPVVAVAEGVTTVYLWGYEGKRLIAKIENADYDRVKSLLGKTPEGFSYASKPDNATYKLIEDMRSRLPYAQVFIYKYTPGLQIESITSPDGQTLFYKYDYLNRLREEYFYEKTSNGLQKKLLNVYDYHFPN